MRTRPETIRPSFAEKSGLISRTDLEITRASSLAVSTRVLANHKIGGIGSVDCARAEIEFSLSPF